MKSTLTTINKMVIKLMLTVPPSGIPTDEEQATGMERIIMKAMQEGLVRLLIWIHCNLTSVLEWCPPSVMFMINRSITDRLDDVRTYVSPLKEEGTPFKKSTYPFKCALCLCPSALLSLSRTTSVFLRSVLSVCLTGLCSLLIQRQVFGYKCCMN